MVCIVLLGIWMELWEILYDVEHYFNDTDEM